MESIKTTLGLGPTDSSSFQEPLSGETGAGTATDPYDAGNANAGKETIGDVSTHSNLQSGQEQSVLDNNQKSSPNTHGNDESFDNGDEESYDASSFIHPENDTKNLPGKSGSLLGNAPKSFTSTVQTDTSGYPGLQGHPLLSTEPTPLATPSVNPLDKGKPPGGDNIEPTEREVEGSKLDDTNVSTAKEVEKFEKTHDETSTAPADPNLARPPKKPKLLDRIKRKLHLKKKPAA